MLVLVATLASLIVKISSVTFLAVFGLFGSLNLTAQSNPPVYAGPYLEAHAGQFEGEWTRSDGTYRMDISVDNAGVLKAGYFNPAPIHVESASVEELEDTMILQVVLRDQGYPGSFYELEYIPQYRVLVGRYTIPGQEPVEVSFSK